MVAEVAVGAVNDRVDQRLQPGALRDQIEPVEASVGAERLAAREELAQRRGSGIDLLGQRAFAAHIAEQVLILAGKAFGAAVAEHAHPGGGEAALRLRAEEQRGGGAHSAIGVDQIARLKHPLRIGMADLLGVGGDLRGIERAVRRFSHGRELERRVAAVVAQIDPLLERQLAVLIAHAQEDFVPDRGMHLLARLHRQREEVVGLAGAVEAVQQRDIEPHGRIGEVVPGLTPAVLRRFGLVHALANAVAEADHQQTALGVGHGDE